MSETVTLETLIRALEQGDELTPAMQEKLLSLLANGKAHNKKLEVATGLSLDCDTASRKQALEALYNLSLFRHIKETKHRRGIKFAVETWIAAGVVKALVDAYGVRVSVAVRAAIPPKEATPKGGTPKEATAEYFDAVSRAYRKLASGYNPGIRIHPAFVSDATDRLDQDIVAKAIMAALPKN